MRSGAYQKRPVRGVRRVESVPTAYRKWLVLLRQVWEMMMMPRLACERRQYMHELGAMMVWPFE